MTSCETCGVRNHAICTVLDPAELAALNEIGRIVTVRKGQTLVREGDDSLAVANIVDGAFKLTSSLEDGREQIIGMSFPADFIGRPFGETHEYSVTALSDARLCVFSRADFEHFARRHPDLEHRLLETTLMELDRARRWMLLLGRKTAAERVASFLIEISERLTAIDDDIEDIDDSRHGGDAVQSIARGPVFPLPFGRQQIADILGLTIETVSRQLTLFKKRGLIELPDRGHVRICDIARLRQYAQSAGKDFRTA